MLTKSSKAIIVAAIGLLSTTSQSESKAGCGSMGLGLAMAAAGTEIGVLLISLMGAGVVADSEYSIPYWQPFLGSFGVGTLATFITTAVVSSSDCEGVGAVPIVGMGSTILTLILWGGNDEDSSEQTHLTPSIGTTTYLDVVPLATGGAMVNLTIVGF